MAAVAGTVLRRVDHLAQQADAAASTMVHGFLTAAGIAVDDRDTPHAAALCAGLRGALEELGGTELRVSESGVREALRRRDGDARALSEDARAAALMVRLLEAGAVRPIAPQASDRLTGPAAMIPVAIFAAVLAELQEQAADPPGSPPARISPTRSRSRSAAPARMARRWRGSSPSSATMSDLTPLALPATAEPVRVAVRRLRWLRAALAEQLAAITAETGVAYRIDDRKLAAAFVSWLRRVEAQNPRDPERRRALLHLRRRVMLEELIRAMPVVAGPLPPGADREQPEYFWPEGFACTVFCMNVLSAVLAQEFDATTDLVPSFFDIRSWWSFRENAQEQASSVVGFFDTLRRTGARLEMPTVFRDKLRKRLSAAGLE